MKQLLIMLLALSIISCENRTQDKTVATSESRDTIKTDYSEKEEYLNIKNKVSIDFEKNKDLLDIILLLPDTAFPSWSWKSDDRIKWYNEIKENNSYIDDDPIFFNQKYFEPTKAGFSIVDGFWSISIYKTTENSFIVVTDDIVADENTLNFYEVKSNRIKEYQNERSMFLNFRELLKNKNTTTSCNKKFEELNTLFFEYDFSKENKIEIESSWYITEEDYRDCLNGNSILYNFNVHTKEFEMEKIYWKPKQNN